MAPRASTGSAPVPARAQARPRGREEHQQRREPPHRSTSTVETTKRSGGLPTISKRSARPQRGSAWPATGGIVRLSASARADTELCADHAADHRTSPRITSTAWLMVACRKMPTIIVTTICNSDVPTTTLVGYAEQVNQRRHHQEPAANTEHCADETDDSAEATTGMTLVVSFERAKCL